MGRTRELERLHAAVDAAAGGRSTWVHVHGPPGVGRSVLLRRAQARATERGLQTGFAACSPVDRRSPYSGVSQVLAALHSAAQFAAMAKVYSGEDEGSSLHLLCDAFIDVTRRGAVLVAVDDLQWADRWTMRWLDALATRLHLAPIVLITAAHGPAGRYCGRSAVDAARPVPDELVLSPLGTDGVEHVLADVLGRPPGPRLATAVFEATRGLPATVLEVATGLVDLRSTDPVPHVDDVAGPIRAVRSARIVRHLSEPAVQLLRALAAGGPRTVDGAAQLCGLPPGRAADARADLVAGGLVADDDGELRLIDPRIGTDVLDATDAGEPAWSEDHSCGPDALDGRLQQILTSRDAGSSSSIVTAADMLLARTQGATPLWAAEELCADDGVLPRAATDAMLALGWLARDTMATEAPGTRLPELPSHPSDPAQAGVLAWLLAARAEDRHRAVRLARPALRVRDGAPMMPRLAACMALSCSGHVDEAGEGLDALLAETRRRPAPTMGARILVLRAMAGLLADRPDEAERDLASAAAELPSRLWSPGLAARRSYIEIVTNVRSGRLDQARLKAEEPIPGVVDEVSRAYVLCGQAELRLAAGTPELVLGPARECGRALQSRGWINPALAPWRAVAVVALRRLGDTEAAERLVAEELEIARRWGDDEFVEAVSHRMAAGPPQTAARAAPRAPAGPVGPDALSPSELEIAELVGRGMSNGQIARELAVAQRTVELRLTTAYRKLGFSGRAGLIDWVTRRRRT